jgi:integrase
MKSPGQVSKKARRKKGTAIEESGVRVRLFKRGEHYWLDVRIEGQPRNRVSAETNDRGLAESNAREFAREIAKQQLLGLSPDTLTLAQILTAYEQHKGQTLLGQWKRAAETRTRLFLESWGDSHLVSAISQSSVDRFSASRRAKFAEKKGNDGEPRKLRDGAIDCDFRWLSSVFNWAIRHKLPDGKRLLQFNPLHDTKWPRERQQLRAQASQERYLKTMQHVDAVDPLGRLRAILALARFTARRVSAICQLQPADILLSRERIVSALAAAGMDEGLADQWKNGAIRWARESDKQGFERITPVSLAARTEIERYLQINPRAGAVPLFPSVRDSERPVTRRLAEKWLVEAERRAAQPKLRGGIFHPYRRLWATERKHLPDIDVAEGGGWTGTKAMKLAYQSATPAGVLAAIEVAS